VASLPVPTIGRVLVGLIVGALGGATAPAAAEPSPVPRQGALEVLTYNVAGLPEGLSAVNPLRTLPLVGAKLTRFDLVLAQEDYAYPELLRSRLQLPYRSAPYQRGKELHFGDGLSVFSKLPFGEVRRAAWRACHGLVDAYFDCLTPKGLAMIRVELSPGVLVDVYDVHLDAGAQAGDVAARAVQLEQLFETILAWSGERAAIIGGDFNLTHAERPLLRDLAKRRRFHEACAALRCVEPWRLDRILFRDGDRLRFKPLRWQTERSFTDDRGAPLSDHLPVRVTLGWRAGP
jgi:endonuclease/exonuclease/phosphatase family metal-dependent hydrolase